MKTRYQLVRLSHRGGTYYCIDKQDPKRRRVSLNTKDEDEANRLLVAMNEAGQQTC